MTATAAALSYGVFDTQRLTACSRVSASLSRHLQCAMTFRKFVRQRTFDERFSVAIEDITLLFHFTQ